MNVFHRIRELVARHQLVIAITSAVVISCIMTAVSLSLYVSSGTLQLDLSRPAYESARKELIKPTTKQDFATNGSINKQTLEEYQKLFDKQRKELNSIGKFKDEGLNDESLTITQEAPQN